jgi:hypothetical protein
MYALLLYTNGALKDGNAEISTGVKLIPILLSAIISALGTVIFPPWL